MKKFKKIYRKNEKDFKIDVSIKTIKNICRLLECCLEDIMDQKIKLSPELSKKWTGSKLIVQKGHLD